MSGLGVCPQCAYARMTETDAGPRCPECGRQLAAGTITFAVRTSATLAVGSRRSAAATGVIWLAILVWMLIAAPWFVALNAAIFMFVIGLWWWPRRGWRSPAGDDEGPIDAVLVLDETGVTPWVDGRPGRSTIWTRLARWTCRPWGRRGAPVDPGVERRRLVLRPILRRKRAWIVDGSEPEIASIEDRLRARAGGARGASSSDA